MNLKEKKINVMAYHNIMDYFMQWALRSLWKEYSQEVITYVQIEVTFNSVRQKLNFIHFFYSINDKYYIIYLDTSFMYIITVLCMIKIYHNRHPDINARASVTFAMLAFIIFIGLLGVLYGSIYFWVLFTIVHLLTCLYMTIQIYYMGRWKVRTLLIRVIQVILGIWYLNLIFFILP